MFDSPYAIVYEWEGRNASLWEWICHCIKIDVTFLLFAFVSFWGKIFVLLEYWRTYDTTRTSIFYTTSHKFVKNCHIRLFQFNDQSNFQCTDLLEIRDTYRTKKGLCNDISVIQITHFCVCLLHGFWIWCYARWENVIRSETFHAPYTKIQE